MNYYRKPYVKENIISNNNPLPKQVLSESKFDSSKAFFKYNQKEGTFLVLKNNNEFRPIYPDAEGYLIFFRHQVKYKVKANRLAYELGNAVSVPPDKVILHKNLDTNDYRLQNLKLLPRQTYLLIKEAHRNLNGTLRMYPHPRDVFSYILTWRDDKKDRILVVQDVVIANKKGIFIFHQMRK